MQRVLREISQVLSLPQPLAEERRYIVSITGDVPEASDSEIVQTYLAGEPGSEIRLRRRDWHGKTVNVLKTTKRVGDHELIETERPVTNALYESLLGQADPYRQPIAKRRQSFIWRGQFFQLDTYHGALDGLVILEAKGVAEAEPVNLPPFVTIVEDVTGNSQYHNYNLALRRNPT